MARAAKGCTTASGSNIRFTPWLENSIGDDDDRGHGETTWINFDPADGRRVAALLVTKRATLC